MNDRPNSLAARDIAYYFHPATNARRHEKVGPMMIERGEGIYVYDDQGKQYIEGLAGPVERRGRLRRAAARQGRRRADGASCRSTIRSRHKSHPAATKLAERLVAMAPGMAKAHFTSSGSEANDLVDQDDLVLQQRARPAGEEEDHLAPEGLSRRHHRLGQPDRHAEFPPRLRPAAAVRASTSTCPNLWRFGKPGRERGGVRDAARRGTRRDDRRRRRRTRSPPSSASR